MGITPKPKPDAGRGKILSTALLALALLASLITFSPFANADSGGETNQKIDICHWDNGHGANWGSSTHLNVDINSIVKNNGHDSHDNDIIPSFGYIKDNNSATYSGKNLETLFNGFTGAAILANGCKLPTVQPTFITVAWKLPDGYADGKATREPNADWPSIWTGGQPFVAKQVTSPSWDLDALDANGAVTGVLAECGALQIDVYRYTTQADKDAVDALWADNKLTKNGSPEDSGLHPVTGLNKGWKFLWTDEDCQEEPEPPVINFHFQKAVCEPDAVIPANQEGTPDHRAGRLTWGELVSKPVGSLAGALGGRDDCVGASGWQFKVSSSESGLEVDSSGVAQGGVLVPGTTNASGVLTVTSSALSEAMEVDVISLLSENGQLWVSEVQQSGFGFENLHCHNDALNADNLDYIQLGSGGDLPSDVYCTAWNSSEPDDPETPPSTIPEQPTTSTVPPTTSTTEEVGGIDEEPTTTTEGPTTSEPEVLDTVVTPTTVAKQTLPKTGSNTSTVLSLAGVLMTAGAAFVLFGRRRFNAGN